MSGGGSSIRLALSVLALTAMIVTAPPATGKEKEVRCDFDTETPSVENARQSFDLESYDCAELELKQLLATDSLKPTVKADAHALLAAIYYATSRDKSERRQKVRREFKEAFRACRYWRGDLAVPGYEFRRIMKDARELVRWQLRNVPEVREEEIKEEPLPAPPPKQIKKTEKQWYKKWWAIGSGVGIVAMAAILVVGSGGDTPPPDPVPLDTLPNFPPPP